MPVATTTIGAYPKPDFLAVGDWFDAAGPGPDRTEPTVRYAEDVARLGEEAESMFARAAEAVIGDQLEAGIDVTTLPRQPGTLRSMEPNKWYYLPAGEYEPHHGLKFDFLLLIRATDLK